MKQYLIRIETGSNSECTTINGDSRRPFQIAHNLWNYTTPGHAARRLEKIAAAWENNDRAVTRIYGTVADMPTQGNDFNLGMILLDYNPKTTMYDYIKLRQKHYHY